MAEREKPGVLSVLFNIAKNFAHAQEEINKGSERAAAYRKVKPVEDLTKQIKERVLKQEAIQKEREQARKFYEQTKPDSNKPGTEGHISIAVHKGAPEWIEKAGLGLDKSGSPRSIEESRLILKTAIAANSQNREILAQFGIQSEADLHSPQAAEYLAKYLLLPDELRRDPHVQYQLLAELAVSTPDRFDSQSFRQYHEILRAGRDALKQARDAVKGSGFELTDREIDIKLSEQGVGGPVGSGSIIPELSNLTALKPKEKVLRDFIDQLKQRETQAAAGGNPNILYDPRWLRSQMDEIEKAVNTGKLQMKDAYGYLEAIAKQISRADVRYREIEVLTPDQIIDWDKSYTPEDPHFGFRKDLFPSDDINLFRSGQPGEDEWLFDFLWNKGASGGQPMHLDITDYQKLETFWNYLKWKYGKTEGERRQWVYLNHLDRRFTFHSQIRILLHEPGDIKEKLKAFRLTLPEAIDYAKRLEHTNLAMSLYDQEARNLMSRRGERYIELLKTRKQRLRRIDELKQLVNTGAASKDIQIEYFGLLLQETEFGQGVMLWDTDVQFRIERWAHLQERHNAYVHLQNKLNNGVALTPQEAAGYAKNQLTAAELQELKYFGFSAIEIEVHENMRRYFEAEDIKVPEYKIRNAILGARNIQILSEHLIQIGSYMVVRPTSGEGKMRAPAFEDIQRFLNPQLFGHRFDIGSALGKRTEALLEERILRRRLSDKHFKVTLSQQWKEDQKDIKDPQALFVRKILEVAEQDMGIPFEELYRGGLEKAGGFLDASYWRQKLGITDKIAEHFVKMKDALPNTAVLDNQALALQFGMLGTEKTEDIQGRQRVLRKMAQRTPLVFLQYGGVDLEGFFKRHPKVDRKIFERAVQLAEAKVTLTHELQIATVDLGSEQDFQRIVAPYLDKLGVTDRAQQRGYLRTIQGLQALEHKHEEQWAKLPFPLTLSYSDFDWSIAELEEAGLISMDRRGRDNEGMAEARSLILEMRGKPQLISPQDFKEYLKKCLELENAINSYSTREHAETVTKEMLAIFLEFNRDRLAQTLGWIPGGHLIAKQLAFTDVNGLKENKLLKMIPGFKVAERMDRWPRSIARAISGSVEFTGPLGNAYNEFDIDLIVRTAQDMGLFTDNPQFASELLREFKATFSMKALALIRRYWWMVIVATIALSAKEAIEDEKKH